MIRNLEQRLELIERLLRLAHEQVDPDQLQLDVRAAEGVLRDRIQLHALEPLADGLVLPAEIGEHDTPERVELRVVRRRPQLLLEVDARRVGVRAGASLVPAERVDLGQHDRPRRPDCRRTARA